MFKRIASRKIQKRLICIHQHDVYRTLLHIIFRRKRISVQTSETLAISRCLILFSVINPRLSIKRPCSPFSNDCEVVGHQQSTLYSIIWAKTNSLRS
ncbi:hypothetical protein HZS_7566 [Henneguya salminicola]|nr:hypothetical protein HZS_7566 [Henneguya salminicola]